MIHFKLKLFNLKAQILKINCGLHDLKAITQGLITKRENFKSAGL